MPLLLHLTEAFILVVELFDPRNSVSLSFIIFIPLLLFPIWWDFFFLELSLIYGIFSFGYLNVPFITVKIFKHTFQTLTASLSAISSVYFYNFLKLGNAENIMQHFWKSDFFPFVGSAAVSICYGLVTFLDQFCKVYILPLLAWQS